MHNHKTFFCYYIMRCSSTPTLKIVFKLPKLTPTVFLFQSELISAVYQLHDLYFGILLFEFQNHLLPTCFRFFSKCQIRNTRDYRIPLFRTSKTRQCIKYVGTKIWIKIPPPTKQVSLSTYKPHFKQCLLNFLSHLY